MRWSGCVFVGWARRAPRVISVYRWRAERRTSGGRAGDEKCGAGLIPKMADDGRLRYQCFAMNGRARRKLPNFGVASRMGHA